jgi:glycine hydroxymethyltransferase
MQYPAVKATDPLIYELLLAEEKRQKEGLELIPSENYASQAVMEAMGSVFTNKYSEGYPHKRYYGGQENIDSMEELAIKRAKEIFRCEHVNIQPYSGSPANTAVYFGLLQHGDKIMGMKLDHGGHITHGLPISYSGKSYEVVAYGVEKETGLINMDEVEEIALREKPKLIIAGFSAYPRNLDWKRFQEIADKVGAITMADIAHIAGLIAANVLENPFDFGFDVVTTTTHKTMRGPRGGMIMCKEKFAKDIDRAVFPGLQGGPHDHVNAAKAICFQEILTSDFKGYAQQVIANAKALAKTLQNRGFTLCSGGTDNHLLLVDLTSKGVTGIQAQKALDNAAITLNKNTIPYETRSPFDPSGIRLGTPAVTTRGMKEPEMEKIGNWIADILEHVDDETLQERIRLEVSNMAIKFPVPGVK